MSESKLVMFVDDYAVTACRFNGEAKLWDPIDRKINPIGIFSSQVMLGPKTAIWFDLCEEIDRFNNNDEQMFNLGFSNVSREKPQGLYDLCQEVSQQPDLHQLRIRLAKYAIVLIHAAAESTGTQLRSEGLRLIVGIPFLDEAGKQAFSRGFREAARAIGVQNWEVVDTHPLYVNGDYRTTSFVNVFVWLKGLTFHYFVDVDEKMMSKLKRGTSEPVTHFEPFDNDFSLLSDRTHTAVTNQFSDSSSRNTCGPYDSTSAKSSDITSDPWNQVTKIDQQAYNESIDVRQFIVLGSLATDSQVLDFLVGKDARLSKMLSTSYDDSAAKCLNSIGPAQGSKSAPVVERVLKCLYATESTKEGSLSAWQRPRFTSWKDEGGSSRLVTKPTGSEPIREAEEIPSNEDNKQETWFKWEFFRVDADKSEAVAEFQIVNDEFDLDDIYLVTLQEEPDGSFKVVARAGTRPVTLKLIDNNFDKYLAAESGMTYRLILSKNHKEESDRQQSLRDLLDGHIHHYQSPDETKRRK